MFRRASHRVCVLSSLSASEALHSGLGTFSKWRQRLDIQGTRNPLATIGETDGLAGESTLPHDRTRGGKP